MPLRKRSILCGDTASVRIQFRMPKLPGNSLLELLGDEMLQPLGLLVQFIDRVIEHAEKERLDQPVMANDLERPLSSTLGQADTPMRFVIHERLIGCGQLLQHIGN